MTKTQANQDATEVTNEVTEAKAQDQSNEPIPFPKTYHKMSDGAVKAAKGDILKLKNANELAEKLINDLTPMLFEHVLGGGNVSVVTELMLAMKKTYRDSWMIFARKHFGHTFDEEANRFGGRKSKGQFQKACDAYEEWKASGHTVMQWIALNTRPPEAKEFDPNMKTRNYFRSMAKHGFDVNAMLEFLTVAAQEEAKREAEKEANQAKVA